MKCTSCNKEVPDGSKFCNHCGHKFEEENTIKCTNCGHMIPADSKFCPDCGSNISSIGMGGKQFSDENEKISCILNTRLVYKNSDGITVFDYCGKTIFHCRMSCYSSLSKKDKNEHVTAFFYDSTDTGVNEVFKVTTNGIDKITWGEFYDGISHTDVTREEFLSKHPKYVSADCLGASSRGLLFVCYSQTNHDNDTPCYADVLDEEGNLLFKTENYACVKVIGKDYIAIEMPETFAENYPLLSFCDLTGKIILDSPVKGVRKWHGKYTRIDVNEFGLVEFQDFLYDLENKIKVSYTNNSIYANVLNNGSSNVYPKIVDVYDCESHRKIASSVELYSENWHYIGGGFTEIRTAEEHGMSLLSLNGNIITLKSNEEVLDSYIAKVEESHILSEFKTFISENRIIISVHDNDDSCGHDSILSYRILDYSGKEIATINNLYHIKRPFVNGKALYLKSDGDYVEIGYISAEGHICVIPFSISKIDQFEAPVSFDEIDCEFFAEDLIYIEKGTDKYLINLNGEVLIKDKWFIPLAWGLFFHEDAHTGAKHIYNKYAKQFLICNPQEEIVAVY